MRFTCLSVLSIVPTVLAASPVAALGLAVPHQAQADDDSLWTRVSELGTDAALRYYLTQSPKGAHVDEARDRLGEEAAEGYDEAAADKVIVIGRSKDNRVEGIHLMFARFSTRIGDRMVKVSLVLGSSLDEDGDVTGNVKTDPFADIVYNVAAEPPEGRFSIGDGSGTRTAYTAEGVTTFLETVSAIRLRPGAPDATSPTVHLRGSISYDSIEGETTSAELIGHLDGRDENLFRCLLTSTSAEFGTTRTALEERLPHAEGDPVALFEYDGIARTLSLVR